MDKWKHRIESVYSPLKQDSRRRDELMAKIAGISSKSPRIRRRGLTMANITNFRWRFASRRWKVAAAILAAMVLLSTGWAAEKIVEKAKAYYITGPEETHSYTLTTPDGKSTEITVGSGSVSNSDSSTDYEIIKGLIAQKKYRQVKTFEDPDGVTNYCYLFKLPDGTENGMNFPYPLEKVSDWNDLQKKIKELEAQREKDIQDAVKNGRYRLVDLDVQKIQLCIEVSSGKKLSVHKLGSGDKQEACIRDYSSPMSKALVIPWEDHLQAIADGRLDLLDIETYKSPVYELTRSDGTKMKYTFCGKLLPAVKGQSDSAPATSPAR